MRTNSKITVLTILIFCTWHSFAPGQELTPSLDPEREVIVMFKSGAVTPSPGRTTGRPDEFLIPSQALRQILQNAKVEALSRQMPDFRPEDRFAVSRTGQKVELTDWTNVYVLRLPDTSGREDVIVKLQEHPEVVYAETNGRTEPALIPNDQFFNLQWALENDGTYGTVDADIDVTQAWDITTGSSSIKIGIVDSGMQTDHPDFTGRVSGDAGDNGAHGTVVAGIAAAQGNNSIGIAGVAWNVGIINEDYGAGSFSDVANAVLSAANRGADVLNNSYVQTNFSTTVRLAFADVYKLDRVAVAPMGNDFGEVVRYPAAFGKGILAVGATTNEDAKAAYSNTGSWIDVTAPGGSHTSEADEDEDYIFSTVTGSNYDHFSQPGVPNWGTSFSAPHVTGIAALLFSYNSSLYNDDIEQIIRLGVKDLDPPGFDNSFGTGRVNAYWALKLIMSPNQIVRLGPYTGGTVASTKQFNARLLGVQGLSIAQYHVKRYEIIRDIQFPQSMNPPSVAGLTFNLPQAWGNGTATPQASTGLPYADGDCPVCCTAGPSIYGLPHTEVVPGTVTNTGCRLRTYVYEVWRTYYLSGVCVSSSYLGFFPTPPANVQMAATVLGVPSSQQQKVATVESAGTLTTTENPESFSVEQNYPNPFNPETKLRFGLTEAGLVELSVYAVTGKKVATLVNRIMPKGQHEAVWNGRDESGNRAASGLYIYQLRFGNKKSVRKMIMAR